MKTCPKCNMSGIPDDAKYCPRCGAELQSISNDANNATSIKGKKKPKDYHFFAASIISFILGLIFCLWAFEFDNHFHSSFLELFAASAAFAVCLILMYGCVIFIIDQKE